ncbi:MAG TPA: polynucleotide adenylyltransferase PcnB [Gammaproteobacteria bacterium]|nr:polynucleotide adenylyltransferase PcnB [Gammaproteobacteria bacterium]
MNSLSSIEESAISINASKVISRLQDHGFQAYLVGGCIRDLLLRKTPKDFDIATDAHPEEVRELFRNSRIIGKRFRIVHVRFGREIIEVTTFRGPHADEYDENHSDSGMTLNDNVYGTFEEDVFRRDFTMNAIYYEPQEKEIIDLADGTADIESQIIRTIGDPTGRLREDPVRMLRAIRFQAKLEFGLESDLQSSIRSLGYLIQDVPPARLFEEVLKLFLSGYGTAAFDAMMENDIYGWLFPDSKRSMENNATEELVRLALTSTDQRIAKKMPVTPAFIYAAVLWYPFVDEKQRLEQEDGITYAAAHEAANNVISKQQLFTSIPKRFSGPMRDIWFLQSRLPSRFGQKPDRIMEHKRFRAAYDFLLLREQAGEKTEQLGEWWTEYQEATEERKLAMKQSTSNGRPRKRKRKPRRKASTSDHASLH